VPKKRSRPSGAADLRGLQGLTRPGAHTRQLATATPHRANLPRQNTSAGPSRGAAIPVLTLPIRWDREFETASLQRRVCKLSVPPPRTWCARAVHFLRLEDSYSAVERWARSDCVHELQRRVSSSSVNGRAEDLVVVRLPGGTPGSSAKATGLGLPSVWPNSLPSIR
jgi:hypothetical protein